MTRPAADRVKATWTGTGTGTMTLGGAVTGEPVQGFPAALNGQVLRYLVKHETAQEAEAGYGTYTSATSQLTRTYRTYPTPGGAAVSFSAGTKHVSVTPLHIDFTPNIATVDPTVNDDISTGYLQGHIWINTANGTVWICRDHTDGAAVWDQINGSGDAGTIATEAEARAGTSNTVYMSPLGTTQHAESREAVSSTGFNPASVQIDDDRQYDTYTQTGAVTFTKNAGGTFRRGKLIQVTFSSDGSALTWGADFEALLLGASLPASLPSGLHTLVFAWNSHRSKIQVAWASLLVQGSILQDTSEVSPSASVSGALTRNYQDGQVQALTLTGNVTSLTISNPPPSGEAGTITFIINHGTGPFTWAHPSNTDWPDGTPPTLSSGASEVSILSYVTRDGGTNWFGFFAGKDFS